MTSKALFLGISVGVFPEDAGTRMSRLHKKEPCDVVCVSTVQSAKSRQNKNSFSQNLPLPLPPACISVSTSLSTSQLGHTSFRALDHQNSEFSILQTLRLTPVAFGLGMRVVPLAPLAGRPLELD